MSPLGIRGLTNAYMMPYNTGLGMTTGQVSGADGPQGVGAIRNSGASTVKAAGRKSSPAECKTCAERKYQDGSDESDVSFQSPTHIDPAASAAAVMGHEREHVANAYEKQAKGEGRVLQASVQLKTAICPECGRSYVAGGVTHTRIAYSNESNPYTKARKSADAGVLAGMNFDAAV